LATVYGIVKQSGGHIEVSSTLGQGTTFTVLWPRLEGDGAAAGSAPPPAALAPRGTETVLLVEDEAPVRSFAKRVLSQLGYRVLVASDGQEALELQASHTGRIDLLISDVIMPRLSGGELARELLRRIPGLPIVFFSGYAPDASLSAHLPPEGFTLISKPFGAEELARAVRDALKSRP
jgi:CheY-like chemotaxis protein